MEANLTNYNHLSAIICHITMVTTRNCGKYVPGKYLAEAFPTAAEPKPPRVLDVTKSQSYLQLARALGFSVAKGLRSSRKKNPLIKGAVILSRRQSSILRQLFDLNNKFQPFGQHLIDRHLNAVQR